MNFGWATLGILSAVFAALVAIFGKIGLKDIDSGTATALRAIIMALFLVIVITLQGKFMTMGGIIQSKAFYYIILSGIAGALSWLCFFLALKLGTASQVAALDRLSIVFVIIFATIFLGEKMDLKTGIGAIMIAAGAILIAFR
jgi:bacterial/archaeal transporter family protein